jgi:hypothetical protein
MSYNQVYLYKVYWGNQGADNSEEKVDGWLDTENPITIEKAKEIVEESLESFFDEGLKEIVFEDLKDGFILKAYFTKKEYIFIRCALRNKK